jgi:acetylornithine aminotransferase/acetylornithine/N-succinyldiaminopimelate aminotransferase
MKEPSFAPEPVPPAIVKPAVERVAERVDRYVAPTYKRSLSLVRGQGARVWDEAGREYLDFGGGIAVNSLGHAHPAVAEAVAAQARSLVHVSNLYYSGPQGRLAERIVDCFGGGKVFLCNSGAEANEALYKLARRAGSESGRYEIITMKNSFHGRTLAGISATGQDKVKAGFGPLVPGFVHAEFNDLESVRALVNERTIAVLIEGIQGEGGIVPATPEFLLGLRRLCDERDLLLLVDAVQCGMFRTGRFMSWERILEEEDDAEAFRADGVSLAKSLGGGVPIGAAWFGPKWQDLLQPGSHGTTFGGTPIACAAALAVFDTIDRENLAQNARRQGELMTAKLEVQAAAHPGVVRAVRGFGCMLGVEFAGEAAKAVAALAEEGLLTIPSGMHVVRLLPPLNVTDAETGEAMERFGRAVARLARAG